MWNIPEIDSAALHRELLKPEHNIRLIDVRSHPEIGQGMIPNAEHCPPERLPALTGAAGDRRVVVYCRSGVRSLHACAWLRSQGVDAINLRGGIMDWLRTGLPIGEPMAA